MADPIVKADVFNFLNNKSTFVLISNGSDLIYAEDLVFHLTSSMQITTICAYLFALYDSETDLWLCPNQELKSLEKEAKLQLRVRFVPSNLATKLRDIDPAAFDYYFQQIRHDFLNLPKKKFSDDEWNYIYGMAIQDIIRILLEEENDNKNIMERSKSYLNHINKYCPKNMVKPKLLFIKNKIKQTFMKYFQSDIDTAKSFNEIYEIVHLTQTNVKKLLSYCLKKQKFYWKKMEKNSEWEMLFAIEDISSINVLPLDKIKICLVNQGAVKMGFKSTGHMKSLISLLSGYYRLTIHWNSIISADYCSPLMNKLIKINCFGPIPNDYVCNKLRKIRDGDRNSGLFLLKQSETDFKTLKICYENNDQIDSFEIVWKPTEYPIFIWKDISGRNVEVDYSSFLILLRKEKNLFQPIVPSEVESIPDLLLCSQGKTNLKSDSEEILRIYHNDQIKKSILTMLNNGVFCTRIGTVKITKNKEERVFIKEFIDSKESNLNTETLLREISEWSKLKNVAIMNCKGFVMHPLSVLFEYCHITLREYYSTQEFKLDHFNLTIAVFFIAKALDYLYTHNLSHGYIKFDNLYVSHISKLSTNFTIKLGDPIGFFYDFDPNREQPWLPPEYFDADGFFFKKSTSYRDVWAFGTTVWEIFHKGNHPEFNHTRVESVNLNGVPDSLRRLMMKCWAKNFYDRIQPSGVWREMLLLYSELYDTRKSLKQDNGGNSYVSKLSVQNKSYYRQNYKKSLFNGYQKRLSLSFNSNNNAEDDYDDDYDDDATTQTTLFEDAFFISEGDGINQPMNDVEYIPKESITVLQLIGKGNYGRVYQARYENKFVALKVMAENKSCSLSEEIKILTKLRHRNIVEILGFTSNIDIDCFSVGKDRNKALVMEFMPRGSLIEFLKGKNPEDNFEMTKFATDIASGLNFLSSKHIIHRDLAARNILVASENSVKIADFGLAHILEDDTQYTYQSERCLPFKWHAPESFERSVFGFESDIWSYGILLWEMYTYCRCDPYDDIGGTRDDVQILLNKLKQGFRLPRPEKCPECVYELMLECWDYYPEKRPTANDVHIKIKAIDEKLNLFY